MAHGVALSAFLSYQQTTLVTLYNPLDNRCGLYSPRALARSPVELNGEELELKTSGEAEGSGRVLGVKVVTNNVP